jgi:hypothetical protein
MWTTSLVHQRVQVAEARASAEPAVAERSARLAAGDAGTLPRSQAHSRQELGESPREQASEARRLDQSAVEDGPAELARSHAAESKGSRREHVVGSRAAAR